MNIFCGVLHPALVVAQLDIMRNNKQNGDQFRVNSDFGLLTISHHSCEYLGPLLPAQIYFNHSVEQRAVITVPQ